MTRPLTIVGAATNIGIKPYADGRPRGLDRAPEVLRALGLANLLDAQDIGDLQPGPYRDFTRVPGRVRNEDEVLRYNSALADRIAAVGPERFVLLLGGDCSIVVGGLLGLRRAGVTRPGLVYVDGHADFATPEESQTGSAASMCLAMAIGRGDTPLARMDGGAPLVPAENVVVIGRRDDADGDPSNDALESSPVLDLPHITVAQRAGGYAAAAALALERVASDDIDGFWIHVDADVIDPAVMPAVDSPEPGGPGIEDMVDLLAPLVRHPRARGLELTIYDPHLDPDRSCGRRLVELLERVLAPA